MEKYIDIKMRDGKNIGGILKQSNNKKIIIFIHGLTGYSGEVQFYESKKYFPKKGYDTLSIDLYSFTEKDKRFLWNTSIKQHTFDVEDVVKIYSKKYSKIFLVGHSIGGPIIYLSKYLNIIKKVKAVCFWEPTIAPINIEKDFVYDKRVKRYFSFGYFMSKKFVDELKNLSVKKISNFKKPFKIILNQDGNLCKNWQNAFEYIKAKYEKILIKNSGHDFTNNNSMKKLLKETYVFFEKF